MSRTCLTCSDSDCMIAVITQSVGSSDWCLVGAFRVTEHQQCSLTNHRHQDGAARTASQRRHARPVSGSASRLSQNSCCRLTTDSDGASTCRRERSDEHVKPRRHTGDPDSRAFCRCSLHIEQYVAQYVASQDSVLVQFYSNMSNNARPKTSRVAGNLLTTKSTDHDH